MTPSREGVANDIWDVVEVLPNLVLPQGRQRDPRSTNLVERPMTLGTTVLAIVAPADPRVVECMDREPAARKLVTGFHDETGHAIAPSVVIVRAGRRLTQDAVNAFRTAIAMSCVLRARAAYVADKAHAEPSWSDHFDPHPTQVNRAGRLATYSPALVGWHSLTAPFVGSPSPFVSHDVGSLFFDTYLYRSLSAEWKRVYGRGRRIGGTDPTAPRTDPRAVFRALEIAYLAAATPSKLAGTQHEWGISVALWVSAIEVLAFVASKPPYASRGTAHDLLGEYPWSPSERGPWSVLDTPRFTMHWKRKEQPVKGNAVQHACDLMYEARNAYLHGNRVDGSLLRPWRRRKGPALPAVAPIVFRTALVAYLQRQYPLDTAPDDPDNVTDYFNGLTYCEAMARAVGLKAAKIRAQ